MMEKASKRRQHTFPKHAYAQYVCKIWLNAQLLLVPNTKISLICLCYCQKLCLYDDVQHMKYMSPMTRKYGPKSTPLNNE